MTVPICPSVSSEQAQNAPTHTFFLLSLHAFYTHLHAHTKKVIQTQLQYVDVSLTSNQLFSYLYLVPCKSIYTPLTLAFRVRQQPEPAQSLTKLRVPKPSGAFNKCLKFNTNIGSKIFIFDC
ncbi:hypothetical protein ILYODFUR_020358 [Ilyodon furcidens]|uniref:Uncharacterized protein n=1 Tax=Ilyodon furcidens TaxID=33524 RepID=A0ABV0U8S9_9TELE